MRPVTEVRRALLSKDCDRLVELTGGAKRIHMPHRHIPDFLVAMKEILPLAKSFMGCTAVNGLGSDYFGVSAHLPTHCDNDYVAALPGTFCSVWVALADVTLHNGPLVVAGKALTCRKGDALVIDGDTPHRSCAGVGPRPVALFTYIQAGTPFHPGDVQRRAEVPLG